MSKKKSGKLPFIVVLLTAVFLYGFSYLGDTLSTVKVPILCYHHLDPDYRGSNQAIVTPQKFKDDLESLKKAGFTTVFFADLVNYTEKGLDLPEKPLIITLDDGYLSNYRYAYPILRELGMKATISLIGHSVGRTSDQKTGAPIIPHLTWDQARAMYRSGLIDFQSHSYDMHGDGGPAAGNREGVLVKDGETKEEYIAALRTDCLKEKNLIEQNIGNSVFVYVYPYGKYSALSEKVLKSLGFKATVVLGNGIKPVNKNNHSLYMLKRIVAGNNISSEELVKRAGGED